MIANIGLMYLSDYGYSIGSSYRIESIYNNAGKYVYNAWLYNLESTYYEWTMTPERIVGYVNAWYVKPGGDVETFNVYETKHIWSIRPTFYLKADVKYASGDGTIDNPYRISIA